MNEGEEKPAGSYDIKLIKYGIIFFFDPALLTYDTSIIKITKLDGSVAFSHAPTNIKRADFSRKSGIFTLRTYTGQKVNISFKGDFTFYEFEPVTKFREYLKQHLINGSGLS